jgi:hypothetical protein
MIDGGGGNKAAAAVDRFGLGNATPGSSALDRMTSDGAI